MWLPSLFAAQKLVPVLAKEKIDQERFRHFISLQVEGTAVGFMSVCTDVNVELLNECFELGAFHGLRKPHPDDEIEPHKSPTPTPQATPRLGSGMETTVCRLQVFVLSKLIHSLC